MQRWPTYTLLTADFPYFPKLHFIFCKCRSWSLYFMSDFWAPALLCHPAIPSNPATAYYISQQSDSNNPKKVRNLNIQVILWFCIIAELFLVGIICCVVFQYTCTNCSEAGGGLFYTSLRRKTSGNLYRDTRSLSQKETKVRNFPQIEAQDDQVVFVVSGLKVDRYQREKTFLEALYGWCLLPPC